MSAFDTIRDLITNFAIVIAYLFLANQVIFRHWDIDSPASLIMKFEFGLVPGMLGIMLMVFTVHIDGTVLDFRELALIISALFGGVFTSIITGLILFLTRLVAFGTINSNTVVAAANSIVIALGVGLICQKVNGYWYKWIYSLLICNILTGIVFLIILGDKGIIPAMIFIFMMAVGGFLTGWLLDFLNKVKRYLQKMESEASRDFLTGLNNHRKFDTVYNSLFDDAMKKEEGLSLALIDIDYFKKIHIRMLEQRGLVGGVDC